MSEYLPMKPNTLDKMKKTSYHEAEMKLTDIYESDLF